MLKACDGHSGGYFVEGAARYRLIKGLFLEANGSYFKGNGRSLVTKLSSTTFSSTGAVSSQVPVSANTGCFSSCCDNSCCKDTCCSNEFGEKFTYKLPTFGLGLKYFHDFCHDCWNIFAGAGMKVFFVRTNAESSYPGCCACDTNNSVGGFVGAGLQWKPWRGLIFEGFIDYLTKTISTKKCAPVCSYECCLDVSGFAAGLGIGYQF